MPRRGGYYYGMKHKPYWEQRSKERLAESFSSTDAVYDYITRIYEKCLLDFCKDYNDLVKPYVRDGELDLGALAAARNYDKKFQGKYRRVYNEIASFVNMLNDKQQKAILKALSSVYKDNVIATFEEFGKSTDGLYLISNQAIETAVKQPFTTDGREFSDRIWNNLNQMGSRLRNTLADSIAKGQSIQKTTAQFKTIFGNSTYNTSRLIRTETMAAYSKASRDSYKALGVEEAEILVEANACETCAKYANKRVNVAAAVLGIDIPPFHPFCRCCISPIVKWDD